MLRKLIILCAAALACGAMQARTIHVHGQVKMADTGDAVFGVTIYNATTDKLAAVTGDNGQYRLTADSNDELLFSGLGCQEQRVAIDGRLELNVSLMPEAQELEEVTVTAKVRRSTLQIDETDLEVTGNFIKLKTQLRIPPRLYSSDVRVIVQPALYNVTQKRLNYLTPIVIDGEHYAITQERMLDWDKELDPLTPYEQVRSKGSLQQKRGNAIMIRDSLYVTDPDEDFMGVAVACIENYNRVFYLDTLQYARGTVKPLRFLEYELIPTTVTDARYLPLPEVELRESAGEMNLVFPVGKSTLDLNLGNNAQEINMLIEELRKYESDPDITLKSFTISGSASPEGGYARNQQLASARMASALELVRRSLDESVLKNAQMNSEASVAPWEEVEAMLRADGKDEEADRVKAILKRYGGMDARYAEMMRLPFYRRDIQNTYLPRLRKVNYEFITSRYRPLTDDEILELYDANPTGLSKYQYYRLYNIRQGAEAEKIMQQALKAYPDFVVAATDLSASMLRRGENPIGVLEPFFAPGTDRNKLPEATRYNMGVACLMDKQYNRADTLLFELPDAAEYHKAKVYSSALNGYYTEVLEEVGKDSPVNEVVLLLAMKNNELAWRRAQKLGDTAKENYIKAIAANRLDDYTTALFHLNRAFELDPSLRETAKIDGDVVDLLEYDELNSESNNQK